MTILHILYSGLGGHGNVFFSMVDADKQNEFTYEALFFGVEDVRRQYIDKAIAKGIRWNAVKKKAGIDLKSYRAIINILKASKPDVVFLHTSAYIIPAKLARMQMRKKFKIVVRETQPNHLKTKFEWMGLVMAFFAADKIVFLSEEYKLELQKKLRGLFFKAKTAVVPNGIDLHLFSPVKKAFTEEVIIGMQSRLSKTKDHATLLSAFAKLKHAQRTTKGTKLLIAGDGECKEELQLLADRLGIADDVSFKGLLSEPELPGFINSLDIYVHATLGETMSTAIMQVMACAKPIIASDVKGVDNMISHQVNGLLVPPKDADKLAAALETVINDKAKADLLAANAYQNALSKFSNERMFASYRDIFLGRS